MTDKEKLIDLLKTGRQDAYVGFTWIAYDTDSTDAADDHQDEISSVCNHMNKALKELDDLIKKLEEGKA